MKEFIEKLPDERKEGFNRLREAIANNLPTGFEEQVGSYGPEYVVPHTLYPLGYHCDAQKPLPFITIASQKNFIALYHMGLYASKTLLDWFIAEYPKYCTSKLDMGKSCIRFKNVKNIPFKLIEALAGKMSPNEWIEIYETQVKT